jgi:hypothetical protein
MKELIQLQTANMFQLMHSNGNKENWMIRENITDTVLQEFSSNISDKLMFEIMHFAREFELKAFNAGIQFAKQQKLKGFDASNPYNINLVKED